MAKDWKDRLGVVYSTNPDYQYESDKIDDQETSPPSEQLLRVSIDRRNRKGKTVTIVEGFIGQEADLKDLSKILKTKCGVGGSTKDGLIIVQGDWMNKIKAILLEQGYRIK